MYSSSFFSDSLMPSLVFVISSSILFHIVKNAGILEIKINMIR